MATRSATAKRAPASKAAKGQSTAPPWDRDNPKGGGEHQHLSPQDKAAAKRRAKAAGRPYPNLVDNMHVAQAAKQKATAKESSAERPAAKKSRPAKKAAPAKKSAPVKKARAAKKAAPASRRSKAATKDPEGG